MNNFPTDSDQVNTCDAVMFLNESGFPIKKATFYKFSCEGKLPKKRFGGKLLFSKAELLDWAESRVITYKVPEHV